MRPALLAPLAAAALLLSVAPTRTDEPKKVPDKAQTVLDKATSIEVWSLEPAEEKDTAKPSFHGWKALGVTEVKGDAKKQALEALTKGLAETATGARCFIPRHGIRAVHDGVTVDLVICFECEWVKVYLDKAEKPEATVTTGKTPQPTLDKILKDANVPLAGK
jgi:hypothetical protein